MKNAASEHQKLRKKIRKFTLKLAEIKKKNKKKIGSNAKTLRKLEPQPEQTFLIKKNKCNYPGPKHFPTTRGKDFTALGNLTGHLVI